jgi:hypothetical protein
MTAKRAIGLGVGLVLGVGQNPKVRPATDGQKERWREDAKPQDAPAPAAGSAGSAAAVAVTTAASS